MVPLTPKNDGRRQGRVLVAKQPVNNGALPSALHSMTNHQPTPSLVFTGALGPISLAGGTAVVYTSLLHHPSSTLTDISFFLMILLAAQYALQPRLSRKYIPAQLNKQSVALVEELVKTGMAAAVFVAKPKDMIRNSLQGMLVLCTNIG